MKVQFDSAGFAREQAFAASIRPRWRRRIWTRIRIVSFEAERYIKLRMPVDTGRARASWGHSSAPAAPGEGIWQEDAEALALTQGSRVGYIEQLNMGSSQQAPAGFIDAEKARAERSLTAGIEDDLAQEWG